MFDWLFGGEKEDHLIIVKSDVSEYDQGHISGLVEAMVGSDNFEDSKLYDDNGKHTMTVMDVHLTADRFDEIAAILNTEHPNACLFDVL